MINRILIRIKVVQLLYSYLLLDSNFALEPQPTSPTREKRFAYSLYLDMLVLMIRLADSIVKRGGEAPLANTRFIRAISSDDRLHSAMMKYEHVPFPYNSVIDHIASQLKESSVYKNFVKDNGELNNGDVRIWETIFSQFIMPNPELNAIMSRQENFSMSGVDRMRDMMTTTFRSLYGSQDNISDVLRALKESLDKARELYFRLLLLPIELTQLREQEIDEAQHKYIVTDKDRYPNLRFVENQLVEKLKSNQKIHEFKEKNKISWLTEDRRLMLSLLKSIKESDLYKEYMEFPATDFQTDCEFWRSVMKQIILENPTFLETLEDKSLFWNDDLTIISTFVIKTFRRFENQGEENAEEPVLEQFKDEEDAQFGRQLFEATVRNRDEYRSYIDDSLYNENWDTDRLAFMDVVIMLTALAELLNFPKIPTSVTVNEYIEMAKAYSTPKSGQFVNGILGAIIARLKDEGILLKN